MNPIDFLETRLKIPTCKECGKVFADEIGYKKHIASHTEEGNVECPICHKFVNRNNFRAHQRTHDSKKFRCDICGNGFVVEKSLKRHVMEVHEKLGRKECEFCGRIFSDSSGYKRHMAKHSEDGMIPCQTCGKLVNKYLLASHARTHEPKEYVCDLCNKHFGTKRCVERHIMYVHAKEPKRHHKSSPSTCSICGKSYSDPANFRRHLETHSDSAKIPCPTCNQLFTRSQLYTHQRIHGPKNFFCERCGKSFVTNSALQKHIQDVHQRLGQSVCSICNKVLANKISFRKHMAGHSDEGKVQCTVCGKLVTKHLLAQHSQIHGEKKYKCDICGKAFHQLPGLQSHLRVGHNSREAKRLKKIQNNENIEKDENGDDAFADRTCNICGKIYSKMKSFRKHLDSHLDSEKVPCKICNELFSKADLSGHKRTHKRPRKFYCEICNNGFTLNSSLKKHYKNIHGKNDVKNENEPYLEVIDG